MSFTENTENDKKNKPNIIILGHQKKWSLYKQSGILKIYMSEITKTDQYFVQIIK